MILLYDTKPCSDVFDSVQAEGLINNEDFSLDRFELLLGSMDFKTFSVGHPKVLICRRSDCLLLVKSDGSFNVSKVLSEEKLLQIISEIESKILEIGS